MVSGPITLWQIDGETMETLTDFILEGSQITADGDCSHEIKKKKFLLLGKNFMTNLDSTLKKQRHYFGNKVSPSEGYGFSCSHVWLWELDYKGSWVPKNWCFWTVVLEKTLESPLDFKEIKPVHPKGNQSWIFTGRTNAKAKTPILWPPDVKSWLIRKDPDDWKDWRQVGKGQQRWDGWIASLTWWTWVWTSSRRWWRAGNPGLLQSMGLQRVRHDWVNELN